MSPNAENMLKFLDIRTDYWMGILYLGIFILTVQCCAFCLLKLLVDRFQ